MHLTGKQGEKLHVCEHCSREVREETGKQDIVVITPQNWCEDCSNCLHHCVELGICAGVCKEHNSYDCGCPGVGI